MVKGLGVNGLAFWTSLAFSVFVGLSAFFFIEIPATNYWIATISLLFFFCLSFFSLKYILDALIIDRIRPIYKLIRKAKHVRKEGQENSDKIGGKELNEVEEEVSNWLTETEEEMNTLKKLETYRRDYIGNVSHELKTPIFNIQGFLHTLLDGAMHDEKFLQSYLEKASANVDRMITVVEDLDMIARLESGAMELEYRKFDIGDLVKEVFDELFRMAKKMNIELRIGEGGEKNFEVKADRDAIRQVLTNLIVNSIKYGKENGHTLVSFFNMENHILVEVADNGLGIKNKHLSHLFDRFYRVDKSRSRAMGGSGLGLSIVKHIIETHKQTINVRSTVGVGTTFGFTLKKAKK